MCLMLPRLGSVGKTGKRWNMKRVLLGEPLRNIILFPIIGNSCPGQTQLSPVPGSQVALVTAPALPQASCSLSGRTLPCASVWTATACGRQHACLSFPPWKWPQNYTLIKSYCKSDCKSALQAFKLDRHRKREATRQDKTPGRQHLPLDANDFQTNCRFTAVLSPL